MSTDSAVNPRLACIHGLYACWGEGGPVGADAKTNIAKFYNTAIRHAQGGMTFENDAHGYDIESLVGIDGMAMWFESIQPGHENQKVEYSPEPSTITISAIGDKGDRVNVSYDITFTVKASGLSTQEKLIQIMSFDEDNKIKHIDYFLSLVWTLIQFLLERLYLVRKFKLDPDEPQGVWVGMRDRDKVRKDSSSDDDDDEEGDELQQGLLQPPAAEISPPPQQEGDELQQGLLQPPAAEISPPPQQVTIQATPDRHSTPPPTFALPVSEVSFTESKSMKERTPLPYPNPNATVKKVSPEVAKRAAFSDIYVDPELLKKAQEEEARALGEEEEEYEEVGPSLLREVDINLDEEENNGLESQHSAILGGLPKGSSNQRKKKKEPAKLNPYLDNPSVSAEFKPQGEKKEQEVLAPEEVQQSSISNAADGYWFEGPGLAINSTAVGQGQVSTEEEDLEALL